MSGSKAKDSKGKADKAGKLTSAVESEPKKKAGGGSAGSKGKADKLK